MAEELESLEDRPALEEAASEAADGNLLPFPIVAVGASAGGLEACRELLKKLTPDTGMAFVLVTHLAPDQKSHLVEILATQTSVPVSTVEHNARPEPNHIYVLPPNAFVTFKSGRFQLEPRPEHVRVPMPIDHFFRSLAADQKSRAIGVILSGADSDGALGLKTIKGEGGIAIVQSPETARHPSMPYHSIAAEHVDVVLPPGEIGTELTRLGRQFSRPELRRLDGSTLETIADEPHLGRILNLLLNASGIDFRQYKPATLQRRIARRMMLNRVATVAEYVDFLQSHPSEVRDLQEDVLINVTQFFRDPEVFEAFKREILPQILDGRPEDEQLRIWVPGCSSGEEVYSLAICLLEYLGSSHEEPAIQIFGTDAGERQVQAARTAIYPDSIVADVSPERLRHSFVKVEKGYQVSKRLRDLCIFARQNLGNDPPFSRLDLISCRNVLIYFNHALQRQIIPTFHYALRANGFLLLGTSETLRDYSDLFAPLDRRYRFYRKLPSVIPANLDFSRQTLIPADQVEAAVPREDDWTAAELQRAADRIVLARYAPPGIVVNDRFEVLQWRGHTGDFFEMSPGASSLQLMRTVRENIAAAVRDAVQRAMDGNAPVQVHGLATADGAGQREFTLEVLPIQSVPLRRRCFLLMFVPAGKPVEEPGPSPEPGEATPPDEKDRLILQLRKELASTKLYLEALIEDRDIKNQDLISANEEVQSANEELQSANEELETTKEEVQSANEELTTVNDELQQRNAVLMQTGNDLNNLLTSINIPLLMLNSRMEIRQFTPPAKRLINVRPSDIGRPVTEISHNLNLAELRPVVQEVLETLATRELEVQDREGRWYLMRVRPYRTTDDKIEGAVVVLLDIDQLRRSQEELRAARDFANAVIESVQVPVAVLDMELHIRTVNSAFRAVAGMAANDLEKRSFPDLASSIWGLNLQTRLEDLRSDGPDPGGFEAEVAGGGLEPRTFLVRATKVNAGGEHVILAIVEENTVRRNTERALESARLALERTQEELRALTASLFRSQEDERRRVARELHDDINQKLALLDMELQRVAEDLAADPQAARAQIEELRLRAGSLSEEVRRISHNLHPSILDDLGLTPALRALVEDFGRREGMLATFSGRGLPDSLPIETSAVLYRIAQEALRNVAKHAGKTHVKVVLDADRQRIRLEVADLGEGFDPEGVRGGLGLISMAERARLIGGRLTIDSGLGKGTTVTVEAPLAGQA